MIYDDEPASSPDPLAPQSLEHSPRPKTTPRKPLADTSNNVRRGEFCFITPPHYANVNSTPFNLVAEAENPISPWRIRVTVQAEQNGKGDDYVFSRIPGETTTTKVPLKATTHGLAPSIPRNGRGASRKAPKSPVKKAGTPKQKRAVAARKATPNPARGLLEEHKLESLSPTKRRRGRPRASSESRAEESEPPSQKETAETINELSRDGIIAPRISRPFRSKAISPTTSDSGSPSRDGYPLYEYNAESPEAMDDQKSCLGRGVRSRGISPTTSDSGALSRDDHRLHDGHADPWDATDDLDLVGFRSHALDPTSEHDEFDSILESEGFSMVSVSSLPSAKLCSDHLAEVDEHSNNRRSNLNGGSFEGDIKLKGKPRSSLLNADSDTGDPRENAEMKERRSLSPPFHPQEPTSEKRPTPDSTPLKVTSATLIPPMIKAPDTNDFPRPLEKPSDGTPRLVRVVRAGIALQGVLSPRGKAGVDSAEKSSFSSSRSANSPIERLNNLFSGFGAGTRRELRAGLRLGEQLAKRQQLLPGRGVAKLQPEDDVFAHGETRSSSKPPKNETGPAYTLRLPGHGETVRYPNLSDMQLPSPERSEIDNDEEEMSWRLDALENSRLVNLRIGNKSRPTETDQNFEGTTIAREEEKYRLERAAVSREIEEANASQVIIINSDSEGEENNQDEYVIDDIWKEQAYASELPSQSKPDAPSSPHFQSLEPRRSQIPSPWRRQSQNALTRQGAADDVDVFWQPSQISNYPEIHKRVSEESLYPNLRHSSRSDSIKDRNNWLSIDARKNDMVGCCTNAARVGDDVLDCKPGANSQVLQLHQRLPVASGSVDVVSPIKKTTENIIPVQKQAPTSWLGYFTNFIPAFREPCPPDAPTAKHRLPNGKRKLPRAGSLEGHLSQFTPWTEAHFRALYFHYAALIECRQRYIFNPRAVSARYAGRMIEHRGWERAVTKDDCAIVDAFMVDLDRRGSSVLEECGKGERRINESLVTKMLFILWMGGVKRGECGVGTGKTGWADDSDKVMWRPELEAWFKDVAKQRSRK